MSNCEWTSRPITVSYLFVTKGILKIIVTEKIYLIYEIIIDPVLVEVTIIYSYIYSVSKLQTLNLLSQIYLIGDLFVVDAICCSGRYMLQII